MFKKLLAVGLLFALVAAQGDDDFGDAADDALEEVDDAVEEVDEALEEATTSAEEAGKRADLAAKKAEPYKYQTLDEQVAEENLWVLLIGISACIDTVWWLVWGWFVYIQTNVQDSTMCINSDCTVSVLPIQWFWGSLTHTTLSWTALSYLWTFLVYMLISVPELIFWIMTMADVPVGHWLFNMWASYPGLYGSCILYFLGVIWPIVQLTAVTGINQPGYTNALIQMIMFMLSWIYTAVVHVMGFEKLNRKYLRENNFEPSVIPVIEEGTKAYGEEVANAADAIELGEDAAADLEEEVEDNLDDASDAAEDLADDAADEGADW